MKSGARRKYSRADAARIWPQVRRRATRSGAVGRHSVRDARNAASTSSPASVSSTVPGERRNWVSARDPAATASQKKSVAPVPTIPPAGTA